MTYGLIHHTCLVCDDWRTVIARNPEGAETRLRCPHCTNAHDLLRYLENQ